MFRTLMTSRRFAPLFWCQFFSAFNDNFVRNMLAMLILFRFGGDGSSSLKILIATMIFVLPAIPLSALGGEIADSHDKALIARRLKLAEIGVQMIAAAGFRLFVSAAALSRAVRARLHRGFVRADQIRHPAGPPAPRRARRRQCAGRRRDLRGDHLRPHRRRLRRGGGSVGCKRRHAAHGHRPRLLWRGALHPADRSRRSGPYGPQERAGLDLGRDQRGPRRRPAMGSGARHELVLDGRARSPCRSFRSSSSRGSAADSTSRSPSTSCSPSGSRPVRSAPRCCRTAASK